MGIMVQQRVRWLKLAQPIANMLNMLLVEGKNSSFNCFYMSEKFSENVEYDALQVQKDYFGHYTDGLPQALPASPESVSGEKFDGQGSCMSFGTTTNGNQDQCINPESLATFIGLLESITFTGFWFK